MKQKASKVIQAREDRQANTGPRESLVPRERKGSGERRALKGQRGTKVTWVPLVRKDLGATPVLRAQLVYRAPSGPLESLVPRERLGRWGPRVSQECGD